MKYGLIERDSVYIPAKICKFFDHLNLGILCPKSYNEGKFIDDSKEG